MIDRIIALMPVRNEVHRYLDSALAHLTMFCDEIVVYDNQSTDESALVAKHYTDHVFVRPDHVPSFDEHEGLFREASFRAMEAAVSPTTNDWVLSNDADEFLSFDRQSDLLYLRGAIKATVQAAGNVVALHLPIPEIFYVDEEGVPYRRTDGLWNTIMSTRLFRWLPGGVWPAKAVASGAEPTYAQTGPWGPPGALRLLHYGYAHPDDVQAKWAHWSARPGHLDSHVASIPEPPTLERWTGAVPKVRRGL